MVDRAHRIKEPTQEVNEESVRARALEKLKLLNLPDRVELAGDLSSLGKKMQVATEKTIGRLRDAFGADLPAVAALAIKCYWHSAWSGAMWMDEARVIGLIADNDYTRRMCIAEGYIEREGGAWTMYNAFASNDYAEQLKKFAPLLTPQPTDIDLLTALSCYFMYQASAKIDAGFPIEAMDLIHEGHDARQLSDGLYMWNEATKSAKEELEADATDIARSELGRAAAIARFQRDPKQHEKRFIRECWEKWHLTPARYPSQAAFARDMLQKCEHIVSQKTIEDWCREWAKREMK